MAAILASLVVFTRSPEDISVQSANGRARLDGQAPRSLGAFTIIKEETPSANLEAPFVSPIYDITPNASLLPLPVRVSISYTREDLNGRNALDLSLARFNQGLDRWEPIASKTDLLRRTVTAETRSLSRWSILMRENVSVPEELKQLADRLLANPPANTVGYTIDLDYAREPETFALFSPSFRRDGCSGFFAGDEQKIVQESLKVGELTYRVTLTWEIGDTSRCFRKVRN